MFKFVCIFVSCFYMGGGDQYKRPFGDVPSTWVPGMEAKSASWYMNSSLTLVLLRGGVVPTPPNGYRPGAQNRTAKG